MRRLCTSPPGRGSGDEKLRFSATGSPFCRSDGIDAPRGPPDAHLTLWGSGHSLVNEGLPAEGKLDVKTNGFAVFNYMIIIVLT